MKSFSNIFIFVVLAGRFGHATCVGTNLRASRRDTGECFADILSAIIIIKDRVSQSSKHENLVCV
jgi:hypothetical protein